MRSIRRGRSSERQSMEYRQRRVSFLAAPAPIGGRGHPCYSAGQARDWAYSVAPPGNLLAIDARYGRTSVGSQLHPRRAGPAHPGTANIWTAMTADPELGMVYAPVSSPSPNYWGGDRTEPIPMATSVTAIHLESGEIVWSFQHVRHDIWDYDTPSAPSLVDIERDGQTVPALVQATKPGLSVRAGSPHRRASVRRLRSVRRPTEHGRRRSHFRHAALCDDTRVPSAIHLKLPDVWRLADLVSFGQCSRDRERISL